MQYCFQLGHLGGIQFATEIITFAINWLASKKLLSNKPFSFVSSFIELKNENKVLGNQYQYQYVLRKPNNQVFFLLVFFYQSLVTFFSLCESFNFKKERKGEVHAEVRLLRLHTSVKKILKSVS